MADKCPECDSTDISFIANLNMYPKTHCSLYSCDNCGIEFILDEEGNQVEDER
jgi:hypothetical protein